MSGPDDDSVWEFFNERAAIMCFDAGLPRYDADFRAYARTRLFFEARHIALPLTGYFSAFRSTKVGWDDDTGHVVVFPSAATLAMLASQAFDEAIRTGRPYSALIRK
ncbi:hypothetical protein [Burkholderia sp. Bp9015]|uniref:hypothetical protein n=1 Tax=Burkholderia sp. Bp9015 TaxID=2184563 RepID=UPI000F59692B|nr:hypothetical protein [Burkholderia sp. Bp9015]